MHAFELEIHLQRKLRSRILNAVAGVPSMARKRPRENVDEANAPDSYQEHGIRRRFGHRGNDASTMGARRDGKRR